MNNENWTHSKVPYTWSWCTSQVHTYEYVWNNSEWSNLVDPAQRFFDSIGRYQPSFISFRLEIRKGSFVRSLIVCSQTEADYQISQFFQALETTLLPFRSSFSAKSAARQITLQKIHFFQCLENKMPVAARDFQALENHPTAGQEPYDPI